ncbi:MAG: lantibiotic immunity ABC transporter MutE/EpiE family permease subunit [Erysipelotrichaceae bacterium]|nr:lantibiotic immunity ABC transporter MutE/EpiE family permease subunit [Erysipelotrichaceae bacterium]MDY5252636.1 lantibiotic immunity ABC transporter MutE/EpiE family permease subunit [Erysipelotrichaceae bacterium]
MFKYVQVELLKLKKGFAYKLIIILPFIVIGLDLVLMQGLYFMEGSYNWWYTLFLPGILSMIISFDMVKEKKHNYHGLFALCIDKSRLWLSKIIVFSWLLLMMNLLFFLVTATVAWLLGLQVELIRYLAASLILVITNLFWIPLLMYLANKFGSFIAIFFSLLFNFVGGILFAGSKLWLMIFAIPARVMCAIIHVLPNGIPVTADNPLCDPKVILPGIIISLLSFGVLSLFGSMAFNKQEV